MKLRGAIPSPRCKAFAAHPHKAAAVPDSWGVIPTQLSIWGNSTYGDCVSAEEAAAKAQYSTMCGLAETFISDSEVVKWARSNGFLNGANLTDVMEAMAKSGMTANGQTYGDGAYQSVDWTNDAVLSSAIYQGPVKIGVAAGQLEGVVAGTNGWWATGFTKDNNEDHCVNLCGFGTAQSLADLLRGLRSKRRNRHSALLPAVHVGHHRNHRSAVDARDHGRRMAQAADDARPVAGASACSPANSDATRPTPDAHPRHAQRNVPTWHLSGQLDRDD